MEHKLYEPEGYEGIAACSVCRGAEASLPTECPGEPMNSDLQDDVQFGKLDFIQGKWQRPKKETSL